jgi:hypothetical protein
MRFNSPSTQTWALPPLAKFSLAALAPPRRNSCSGLESTSVRCDSTIHCKMRQRSLATLISALRLRAHRWRRSMHSGHLSSFQTLATITASSLDPQSSNGAISRSQIGRSRWRLMATPLEAAKRTRSLIAARSGLLDLNRCNHRCARSTRGSTRRSALSLSIQDCERAMCHRGRE